MTSLPAPSFGMASLETALEYASLHARLAALEAQYPELPARKRPRVEHSTAVQLPNSAELNAQRQTNAAAEAATGTTMDTRNPPEGTCKRSDEAVEVSISPYAAHATSTREPPPELSDAPSDSLHGAEDETLPPEEEGFTLVDDPDLALASEEGLTQVDDVGSNVGLASQATEPSRKDEQEPGPMDQGEQVDHMAVAAPALASSAHDSARGELDHEAAGATAGGLAHGALTLGYTHRSPMGAIWHHPRVAVHSGPRLVTPPSLSPSATPTPAADLVVACGCLADGRLAVLHTGYVTLWETTAARGGSTLPSADARPPAGGASGWHLAIVLRSEGGAAFHTLAYVHTGTIRAGVVTCGGGAAALPADPPLIAACGRLGGRGGAPAGQCSGEGAADGVAIFRVDGAYDGRALDTPVGGGGGVAEAARVRSAAQHLAAPAEPLCASLVPTPMLSGLDELPGTTLALGGADGHVYTWRLSTPPSESWMSLPSPPQHEPAVAVPRPGTSEADADAMGGSGASSARHGVLALCAVGGDLGMLVGGYAWGAALWQLPSRRLVNVFERQDLERPLAARLLSGREYLDRLDVWKQRRSDAMPAVVSVGAAPRASRIGGGYAGHGGDAASATVDVANAAALIVALPLATLPRDVSGMRCVGLTDPLGSVAVGGAWSWLRDAPAHGESGGEDGNAPLARRFVLSRGGCTPSETYGTSWRVASPTSRAPMLVRLMADGTILAGTDAVGWAHVWSAGLGHHLASLPPPSGLRSGVASLPPPHPVLASRLGPRGERLDPGRCRLLLVGWGASSGGRDETDGEAGREALGGAAVRGEVAGGVVGGAAGDEAGGETEGVAGGCEWSLDWPCGDEGLGEPLVPEIDDERPTRASAAPTSAPPHARMAGARTTDDLHGTDGAPPPPTGQQALGDSWRPYCPSQSLRGFTEELASPSPKASQLSEADGYAPGFVY